MDERRSHLNTPSDDRDVELLLRMAGEVEAMENWAARHDVPAPLKLADAPGQSGDDGKVAHPLRSRFGFRVALASAACLGIAAGGIAYWAATYSPQPTNIQIGHVQPIEPPTPRIVTQPELTPDEVAELVRSIDPSMVLDAEAAATGVPDRDGVVLAIIEDEPGKVRCVRWTDYAWEDGRSLADVGSGELLSMSSALNCNNPRAPRTDTPSRVVVVGLEGPAHALPRGDGVMNLLAECILQSPAACGKGDSPFHASAVQCLPGDVQVKVESLAIDRERFAQ